VTSWRHITEGQHLLHRECLLKSRRDSICCIVMAASAATKGMIFFVRDMSFE